MNGPEILVANEPRVYREVIAGALGELRPHLGTVTLEPDELDAALRRDTPHLVVCSDLTPAIRAHASSWVLLHPGGAGFAAASIGGHERLLPAPTFADLLAFLDDALALVGNETAAAPLGEAG